MAFPYIFESNFEGGTNAEWDSETDTVGQLSIAHYKTLARLPYKNSTPFSGAYAMQLNLTGGTADAFLTEGDINYAANATGGIRFTICFLNDFAATANDTFSVFELQGAAAAIQLSIGFRIVASSGLIEVGAGKAAPTSFGGVIERGKHYTIEADINIDDGGSNDGTCNIYITKENEAPGDAVVALTGLDQVAVTDGVLGIQDHLATTTGHIIISDFTADDTRLYPRKRFALDPAITKTAHLFIGRGCIDAATILSTTSADALELWDSDAADSNLDKGYVVRLENGANSSGTGPFFFQKGCYAVLSGTNPFAQAYFVRDSQTPGVFGPVYHSTQGYKELR